MVLFKYLPCIILKFLTRSNLIHYHFLTIKDWISSKRIISEETNLLPINLKRGVKMEQGTISLNELREKVKDYLKEEFGGFIDESDGDFSILYQSAKIFICPREWSDGYPIVRIFSITDVDVPESPKLFKFLATENFKLLLGNLSYDEENLAVWFEHILLGNEVSKESLITVISAVAIMADKYDDLISERFGGIRYTDA